jgi:hypothetical protein
MGSPADLGLACESAARGGGVDALGVCNNGACDRAAGLVAVAAVEGAALEGAALAVGVAWLGELAAWAFEAGGRGAVGCA